MNRHNEIRYASGGRSSAISLLELWPDLAEALADDERRAIAGVAAAAVVRACDGVLPEAVTRPTADVLWLAIVQGRVLKETTLAARSALEVLGPGDLLAPPLSAARQNEFRGVSRYLALGDVSLAVLGIPFTRIAARFPQASNYLHRRLAEQAHRASMHLAMLHLPRAEDRILLLFTDLAERFGRVSTNGILIDLHLTHDLIGRLIGSRRPTVSLALIALSEQGLLSKHDDNRWKLTIAQPHS